MSYIFYLLNIEQLRRGYTHKSRLFRYIWAADT